MRLEGALWRQRLWDRYGKAIISPAGKRGATLPSFIEGKVWLDGTRVTESTTNINGIRSRTEFVFQDFNLSTYLRDLDNVRIGLMRVRGMRKKEATELATQELRRVGLSDKANAYAAELSGCQQHGEKLLLPPELDEFVLLHYTSDGHCYRMSPMLNSPERSS